MTTARRRVATALIVLALVASAHAREDESCPDCAMARYCEQRCDRAAERAAREGRLLDLPGCKAACGSSWVLCYECRKKAAPPPPDPNVEPADPDDAE